jgi:hypothetical protein
MSNIEDALTALTELTINTKTKTPVVYGIKNGVHSVRGTPARVVFPMQVSTPNGQTMQRVTLGGRGSALITWVVADLLLFDSVKQGTTLQSALPELLQYVVNYIDVIRDNMSITENIKIESIDYDWDVFTFPENSNNQFYGCLMTLSLKEIMQ